MIIKTIKILTNLHPTIIMINVITFIVALFNLKKL
jgi:hypothetical protein